VNGKKPELIDRYDPALVIIIEYSWLFCRVCNYIKYGWDLFLVDPDGGVNVQNKLKGTFIDKKSESSILLQTIPNVKDKGVL